MGDQDLSPAKKLPFFAFGAIAASGGVVAIGMNAVGSFMAIGLNTAAPISLGAVNAVGLVSFSFVNAVGPYAIGGVNGIGFSNPIAGLVAAGVYAFATNVILALALRRAGRPAGAPALDEPSWVALRELPSTFNGWTRVDEASVVGSSLLLRADGCERAIEQASSDGFGELDQEERRGPFLVRIRSVMRPLDDAQYRSAAARIVFEAIELRSLAVPKQPLGDRLGGPLRQVSARAIGSACVLALMFVAWRLGWLP